MQIKITGCPPKPALEKRDLLTERDSEKLAGLFKVIANSTRLQLIHAIIRNGRINVTNLSETVDMKPQAVSNQLQKLKDKAIITSEREGNNIYYSILDPCIPQLIHLGLCLNEELGQG